MLALSIPVLLAGCASNQAGEGASRSAARDLPPAPLQLKAQAAPALDTQCRFPWYGMAGCKGKDARALLRLTTSDAIETRKRLDAAGAWYENLRREYGAR